MVSLDCFFLVLHPLSSLINNDLNLPLGSQGRSRKLNEAYFRVHSKVKRLGVIRLRLSLQGASLDCREGGVGPLSLDQTRMSAQC